MPLLSSASPMSLSRPASQLVREARTITPFLPRAFALIALIWCVTQRGGQTQEALLQMCNRKECWVVVRAVLRDPLQVVLMGGNDNQNRGFGKQFFFRGLTAERRELQKLIFKAERTHVAWCC